MDNGDPPCRRCIERNLSCVLNKSLQTLISEGSAWKDDMHHDLANVHSVLQDVLKRLSMPALPALRSMPGGDDGEPTPLDDTHPQAPKTENAAPSIDSSPKLNPQQELQGVPIESLYQITRLRSLRAESTNEGNHTAVQKEDGAAPDLVTRGVLSIEDAERLTNLYLRRLDHFAYNIANKYTNLQGVRRGSAILTAAICTVAALHDPHSNHLFEACLAELKRILSASMFDKRIDREALRGMCIGSFWLSDLSWMLSGHAIRRAMAINLNANYHRLLAEPSEDAIDCLRIWYFLYICDQHLSILYGRTTIIRREETSIQGTMKYIESVAAVEQDRRMASQVTLLVIMGNARLAFGRDTGGVLPPSVTEHLAHFSAQLDDWMHTWIHRLSRPSVHHPMQFSKLTAVEPNESIGNFPAQGIELHFNLAKLHLHSHVFRGLGDSSVPSHFHNSAVIAATAATRIFELLLTEPALRDGLVGMPHYTHTMIAFACAFILQLIAKYGNTFADPTTVYDLIGRLVEQLRSTPTGNWHLVRSLTEGLEKMLKVNLRKTSQPERQMSGYQAHTTQMSNGQMGSASGVTTMDFMTRQSEFAMAQADPFTVHDFGLSNPFLPYDETNSIFRASDFGYH